MTFYAEDPRLSPRHQRHETDAGYLAYFPSLPGCPTRGETDEAVVKLVFSEQAWADYRLLAERRIKKTLERINTLIKECSSHAL